MSLECKTVHVLSGRCLLESGYIGAPSARGCNHCGGFARTSGCIRSDGCARSSVCTRINVCLRLYIIFRVRGNIKGKGKRSVRVNISDNSQRQGQSQD